MKTFNKIILGFILSVVISAAEAQTTNIMFAHLQTTKRVYKDSELILPNNLQYEKIGAAENELSSSTRNNLVQISWKTATETNTSHFELQCSKDGINFEPIETIAANGISKKSSNYSTIHTFQNVNNDPLYFRVKNVFVNGKEAFTSTLVVDLHAATQLSAKK